ncbi:hypothetical protein [uncultured Tenacibaculum sp.]|uniref:hypothetical protein n=1 Tax=uncultured Tenacibaculum sp. TaxID=174713 RepID=UPI002635C3DC|nr:hypothetical protein [uncultured Tenacibaculum sp.]
MNDLNSLEKDFFILIEKLKNDTINISDALLTFEDLISKFEFVSQNDISLLDELKKEFKRLSLQIIKLKEIDANIEELESNIEFYKLKLFGQAK